MFSCKFAHMYDNKIFLKYHKKPVAEDYFKVENNIFCVADGVTRDSVDEQAVPYPETKQEVEEWIEKYPKPSGAYEAAKICAENFVMYLSKFKAEEITTEIVSKVIKKVNHDILEINKGRKINYLKDDLYCCEAVGGIIVGNKLYCFSIGDCHITVFSKERKILFTTKNNHKQFEDYLNDIYIKHHKFDWNNPEDRIMVRRDYRNNPDQKYRGKDVSFGALSGEKEAEYYIDVYEVDLDKAQYICAYSDGCEPIFDNDQKIEKILNNPESLKEEGKERTLILFEKED